ncbi:MAG: N-acetylmuramoyl-L-alanine amidase [Deltaproteobacteria bacterium]|nr:N-acetylmuramoyl-L-alanine amidase [Deltaproteobacteria bacterium]
MRDPAWRKYVLAILFSALVVFYPGCAAFRFGADPAGYGGRGLVYEGVDFSVLIGKKIVIDPGHGGIFTGAVGPGGLTEKEVNLRVALILRDLLQGYGATVVLTREKDEDLLAEGAESSLRADLAARVDTANVHQDADVFLSIHHNSLGVPNDRYNATETYYKLGDEGPSLDLARYLHRQLTLNVNLPRNSILPGNYFVLRNSRHPAVLGEASYLSHRGAEKKLRGESAVRIEAYAYLLGIVDYLSGGVPVIEGLRLQGAQPVQDAWPLIEARIYDESTGLGIDPQQIEVAVDGTALVANYDPASGSLRARAAGPLSNGRHQVSVRVRNLRGNAAREGRLTFAVAVPPAYLSLSSSLSAISLDGRTPVCLTAVAADIWGRPVCDSTEVLFVFSDPNLETCTMPTADGRASVTVTPAVNRPLTVKVSCGNVSDELTIPVAEPLKSILVIQAKDALTGKNIAGLGVQIPGLGLLTTGADGILTLEGLDDGEYRLRLERSGYRPEERNIRIRRRESQIVRAAMQPVFGGALLGRRVVLDPQGGLGEPGEIGARGMREADLNLAVAQFLGDYLKRAGADVFYTRSTSESPNLWERVARTENFHGDVLISISHRGKYARNSPPPATLVQHYPNSTGGRRLAEEIASSLRGFAGRPYRGAVAGYERIIQQVSCPAVWVRATSVADPAAERLLEAQSYRRAQAYAIFTGLCRYFGLQPEGGSNHLAGRLSDGRGNVISGALVMLDGWLPVQSDNQGCFMFCDLDGQSHLVEIFHRGKAYGPYQALPGRNLELVLGAP